MGLRKIKATLLIGCTVFAVSTSSCIMDRFDDVDGPVHMLPKGKYVIGFRFQELEPSTRAATGEYDDGEHFEHEIGSDGNYVIFFDANKTVIDVLPLYGTHDEPSGYIEGTYLARYDVDEEEFVRPEYCMAILNAGHVGSVNKGAKAEDIVNDMIVEGVHPLSIGFDGNGRFTMTNTVYISGGEKTYLFEIPEEVIQDYREPHDPEKVIHATVERMVAKFDFSTENVDGKYKETGLPSGLPEDCKELFVADEKDQDFIYFTHFDDDGAPQYELRKWKAAITGWSMNALAKEEYSFKHVEPDMNPYQGWNWNDEAGLRSDWAIDKYYKNDSKDYPWQYRRAVTAPLMATYEKLEKENNNHLLNFSYDDIVRMSAIEGEKNGYTRSMYTPENTYDFDFYKKEENKSTYLGSLAPDNLGVMIQRLDERTDVLAGTHLIVTARLLTNIDGDGYKVEENLYRDRSSMFYRGERNCFNKLITTFNYDLQSQLGMRYHYYEWTDEDKNLPSKNQSVPGQQMIIMPEGMYSLYYVANDGKEYELHYRNLAKDDDNTPGPAEEAMIKDGYQFFKKAEVEDGDGKVIINTDQLVIRDTKDPTADITIHAYTYEEYKKWLSDPTYEMIPLREATRNDITSLIYEWTGAVDHFNEGRMYYFKPAGLYQIGIDDKTKQPIYFCGTVRNNWYQYSLKRINSIGTSIDDPTQPIVPQLVPVNSQIELNLKMIDWHNVNAGINGIR